MKIGIHSNQFDGRGTGKVPLDYGLALKKYFNHDIVYITSVDGDNQGVFAIEKHFRVIKYNGSANTESQRKQVKENITKIVAQEGIDFLYMVKWGTDDQVTPTNCKTGVHCCFEMTQPHGNVYAGVSEYITKKYNQALHVPHIIKRYDATSDIRKQLNIPSNTTVIGRIGGMHKFDLPFARQAVTDILKHRSDVFFIFISTEKFIDHEKVLFVPWVSEEQEKYNYIHACDAMLHARSDGETFGIAVGEFSACNKPIITWSGNNAPYYDKCHLDILGKKAIIYNDYTDLLDILYSIDRTNTVNRKWDMYSERFSEKNVIDQFNKVFLS